MKGEKHLYAKQFTKGKFCFLPEFQTFQFMAGLCNSSSSKLQVQIQPENLDVFPYNSMSWEKEQKLAAPLDWGT